MCGFVGNPDDRFSRDEAHLALAMVNLSHGSRSFNICYETEMQPIWVEPHWRHCVVVLEQDTFILA